MRTYSIEESSVESIEFKVDDTRYALVHKLKATPFTEAILKVTILSKRGGLNLYQALQEEILNKRSGG